jgi:hypothetical protein
MFLWWGCVADVVGTEFLAGGIVARQFWHRGHVILVDVLAPRVPGRVTQWLHRLPLYQIPRPASEQRDAVPLLLHS